MSALSFGMMWWNDSPKDPIEKKVLEAAEYYFAKYGRLPDICYVNPAAMPDSACPDLVVVTRDSRQILVRALKTILPHHLWIGVAESEKASVTDGK